MQHSKPPISNYAGRAIFSNEPSVQSVISIHVPFPTEDRFYSSLSGLAHSNSRIRIVDQKRDGLSQTRAVFLVDQKTGLVMHHDFRESTNTRCHDRASQLSCLKSHQGE